MSVPGSGVGWEVTEVVNGKVNNTNVLEMMGIVSAIEKILFSAFKK